VNKTDTNIFRLNPSYIDLVSFFALPIDDTREFYPRDHWHT